MTGHLGCRARSHRSAGTSSTGARSSYELKEDAREEDDHNHIAGRYARSRNPFANLKTSDHTDIPFATQHSDNQTSEETYGAYAGKEPASPGNLDRGERGELYACC